jgi:two-component system, NtrC family, response regulator HydG
MRERRTILVLDRQDDPSAPWSAWLRDQGVEVVIARDSEAAFELLERRAAAALIAPLGNPAIDGLALLRRAVRGNPTLCAVMIAEGSDPDLAAQAILDGAADVQPRPPHRDRLLAVLRRGFELQDLSERVAELRALERRGGMERVVGISPAMERVVEQMRHLGATRVTIMIQGEAGTGKSFVARALHGASSRRGARFVWVGMGIASDDVTERELFGVERPGDDDGPRRGRIELAEGGTLFLHRIEEASPALQKSVLRLLRDREFERVGGEETRRIDVRVIVSTRRDLAADADAGRFRADLLQRLDAVVIHLPPLRERAEDIPVLVEGFLRELNREHGRKVTGVTRGTLERLMHHHWPGNVRQLRSTLEGMVVVAEGKRPLDVSDLPAELAPAESTESAMQIAVGMTLEDSERRLLEATLRQTGFDKPRAASLLGIGLRTLYRKIERYRIR